MYDGMGRKIEYLRISLTAACNLHCRYCRPEGQAAAGSGLHSDELLRVVRLFARLGIKKVRLTGGEPLLYPHLPQLIEAIKTVDGIEEIALTTNGVYLAKSARELADSGLDAINVSLDTPDRRRYLELTGEDCLPQVLAGLEELKKMPLKVKLNAVPLKGVNEDDLLPLALIAKDTGWDVRFITLMPVGCADRADCRSKGLAATETRQLLEKQLGRLIPVDTMGVTGPAEYYRADGFRGRIGFIDALNKPFCELCNRVRITADGFCKLCLYSADGIDLLRLLRAGYSEEIIMGLIQKAVINKPARHQFESGARQDERFMYEIGG